VLAGRERRLGDLAVERRRRQTSTNVDLLIADRRVQIGGQSRRRPTRPPSRPLALGREATVLTRTRPSSAL